MWQTSTLGDKNFQETDQQLGCRVKTPSRTNGAKVHRLEYCSSENRLFHHDSIGATNIAISGEKQRLFGLPACPIEGMQSTLEVTSEPPE